MNEEYREVLRALSLFLTYPQEMIPDPGLSILPDSPGKQVLADFWHYRQGEPSLRLQEEYTRTFDLNPSTCLNLTFHCPESQSRGNLLLRLRELYEDAGYENLPGELPDYLPLMLEFLAVCPDPTAAGFAGNIPRPWLCWPLVSKRRQALSRELMELVKDSFCANS